MATQAGEDYLKAIYTLSRESPTAEAAMSRIAAAVGVTTGTATTMVKKLAAAKLARYERFGGVSLSPKGTRAALDILRRHRLVETFLVHTLKLDWSLVHDEAERLEHAISPRVLEALDAHLNHPTFDPHGDPIPSAAGEFQTLTLIPLASLPAGSVGRLARVLDQRKEPLTFLRKHALELGSTISVISLEPGAGTIHVRAAGAKPVALSLLTARSLLIDLAPPAKPRRR